MGGGVPVYFAQRLGRGRLEPVRSDLHPCSFLTQRRRCCPAHPPVLAESALSGSHPLSSVPAHSSLHLTVPRGGLLPHWETDKGGNNADPAWERGECNAVVLIYYSGLLLIYNNSLVKRLSMTSLIVPLEK